MTFHFDEKTSASGHGIYKGQEFKNKEEIMRAVREIASASGGDNQNQAETNSHGENNIGEYHRSRGDFSNLPVDQKVVERIKELK